MTEQSTHPAAIDVGGQPYLRDAKGALVPLSTVKATDLLMDELVRKTTSAAASLSDRISRFKTAAFNDVGEFQALLAQEYDAAIGGKKGNITLSRSAAAICGVIFMLIAVPRPRSSAARCGSW